MQTNECPKCKSELDWSKKGYHCGTCQLDFDKIAYCSDCNAKMEKLAACGATSYFCNNCNELKSKSKARFEYTEVRSNQ